MVAADNSNYSHNPQALDRLFNSCEPRHSHRGGFRLEDISLNCMRWDGRLYCTPVLGDLEVDGLIAAVQDHRGKEAVWPLKCGRLEAVICGACAVVAVRPRVPDGAGDLQADTPRPAW